MKFDELPSYKASFILWNSQLAMFEIPSGSIKLFNIAMQNGVFHDFHDELPIKTVKFPVRYVINIPADLAPAHDCPKIVVLLWRQRDFMGQTTITKKHPLYCGLQPLQGFVLQNPTNEQSGLFSSPHERSVAVSKSKPVCSHLHC